ncbi:putative oxidoreductase, aryl-alcohol dehydrogenase like protein [Rhizobium leguminosarum bv. trifolii WSM2297]|uniref:Putative oxidoreductase, aryl-alcohol dehydrogenase like protein n=1 Tax=Rhizobium leguminosarum bv. trifolii WSM2297 TaxID=754762 RepID=J0W1X5_RHILT|nr:aldo/keto reductase [Rhizobium leguminosarum]EJC79691.1 putative oxidoreductase, aryl-alcohol dehydrogenase like protein [Rhizobium leguminosarum bv. trifolii WSM2297]
MRYRIFGRTGLRVSTFALGTGNFGTGWGYGSSRQEAKAVFDTYRDAGGNFIDTADQYQFGQSETMIGEFIAGDRDSVVVATKFSLGDTNGAGLHRTGNSRKAMVQSVEASLKRLGTDRIDLLWVHMPDAVTPIDEIVRGLDDLARAGKILYSGLSDFPAWRVSTAATLAELRGWNPVSALQFEYSLVERTAERELLPMAAAFGLGTVGWSPLGGGLLTGKYRKGETGRAQGLGAVIHGESDARKTATVDAVLAISEETGIPAGRVAIAWVLDKGTLPILGPRTPEQLADNLASLDVRLTVDQLARLDAASAIPLGFPHDVVAGSRDTLAGSKADLIDWPAVPVR